MSGKGLSYGLSFPKKGVSRPKHTATNRRPIFGEDDASEDEEVAADLVEDIVGTGNLPKTQRSERSRDKSKQNSTVVNRKGLAVYADLSTSFSSKKHADAAEEADASIYDYDAVYDSLKPQKKIVPEDIEKKPKYMSNLIKAAAVRKRDATIAEEKKLAREREAEGEEFVDKEKFVTSAYKKQQEESRRLEEEERIREAEELRNNKGGGMTGFFKSVLEKGEQKHSEIMKAAEEAANHGPRDEKANAEKEKTEAELAQEINEKHKGAIVVNDEGQVVDKRQLLKGGLNIVPKAKKAASSSASGERSYIPDRKEGDFAGASSNKQTMRERQTRMLEAQFEQATKRALEAEDEERQKVERASKSRKTEGEILSAKERYLQRKREAEVAKKRSET